MRAFKTTAIGTTCIVFEDNAGKARYATYLSAQDAGYQVSITEITCRRAKGYDNKTEAWGVPIKKGVCYIQDGLKTNPTKQKESK